MEERRKTYRKRTGSIGVLLAVLILTLFFLFTFGVLAHKDKAHEASTHPTHSESEPSVIKTQVSKKVGSIVGQGIAATKTISQKEHSPKGGSAGQEESEFDRMPLHGKIILTIFAVGVPLLLFLPFAIGFP